MKKYFLSLFLVLLASSAAFADGSAEFFSKADAFFKANVSSSGGVYYASIKENTSELDGMVAMVKDFPFSSADKKTQKAFLINAYNILVIKNVVDHYPIAKPLDVPGFFDQIKFNVAGMSLTLSDIENKKIRPLYKDARTHFVLVCAAKSCPPIANYAIMPATMEAQLDRLTKAAMNRSSFTKVDAEAKTVQLSQIFEWYKDDFLAEAGSLVEWVNKYRSTSIPSSYKQSFYTYNWALNVKKK